MNGWKIALVVSNVAWLLVAGWLAWFGLDSGVTIGYMQEGYRDCERHRDLLDALLIGRVSRGNLAAADGRLRGRMGAPSTRDAIWTFDSAGRYLGSGLGASRTNGFSP